MIKRCLYKTVALVPQPGPWRQGLRGAYVLYKYAFIAATASAGGGSATNDLAK